jgi:GH25 family lysozyme M1 (1,4-beta-N-acetylmuramidase)
MVFDFIQNTLFKYQLQRYGEQRHAGGLEKLFAMASSSYDPIPTDPNVCWGCDFSGTYDGIVNMQVLKNRGASFVWIKAADGTAPSKYYKENALSAIAAGLPFGFYVWLYRNQRLSGSSQANAWWNITKDFNPPLGWAIDLEWTRWAGQPDNPTQKDAYGAMIPFQQLSGKPMIVYTAVGYANQYLVGNDWMVNNPLWEAQYGKTPPDPILIWGSNYKMQQVSPSWDGSQLGVDPLNSKAEDGDIWNGSKQDFYNFFGINQVSPPSPPIEIVKTLNIYSDGSFKEA